LIAQKDIPFSNSKIDAFNKIIKYQFLLPRNLENRKQLISALAEDVPTYNTIRPQFSLEGNTLTETFEGKIIDLKSYKSHFEEQKRWRVMLNYQNKYKNC
jgi:putative transposase